MPRTSTRFSNNASPEKKLRAQIQSWLILIVIIALIALGIYFLRSRSGTREIDATLLPCTASQEVTPFGENILYYDNSSLQCISPTGSSLWSLPVGANAHFSASDSNIVVWSGARLFTVNKSGTPTYNENQIAEVQFARISDKYCVAVVGEDTAPTLVIRALDGTSIDEESEAYNGLMLIDCGFYGEADQYLWTLAMDIYGTAINTILNTFQVGKMNTGIVSLGEFLAYKVIFENNQLRVFTTQQMYSYDYKGVQNLSDTRLVYGWYYLDSYIPERGSAYILLAPNALATGSQDMRELRVLYDSVDRRYTLPKACIGAAIQGKNLYALASDYLYRADVDKQSFYGYKLPLNDNSLVTSFYGLTTGGKAIVACGSSVYSITLPK